MLHERSSHWAHGGGVAERAQSIALRGCTLIERWPEAWLSGRRRHGDTVLRDQKPLRRFESSRLRPALKKQPGDKTQPRLKRKRAGVVERGSLENCYTRKGIGGSNPPASELTTFYRQIGRASCRERG